MKTQDKQEFLIASEEEMREVVNAILPSLKSGAVIFLEGDLGAGKTTLTRQLLKVLGFSGKVKSPTFSWVEPYDLIETHGFMLYHYDLYRLEPDAENDIEMLDLREHLAEKAWLIIEWPDRLKRPSLIERETPPLFPGAASTHLLPDDASRSLATDRWDRYRVQPSLHILIEIVESGRRIVVTKV